MTKIKSAREIRRLRCSIQRAVLGEIIFTNLYQSKGKIGNKLKTAKLRLIVTNKNQKKLTKSNC